MPDFNDPQSNRRAAALQVLLVDVAPAAADAVRNAHWSDPVTVTVCATLAEARQIIDQGPIDVAIINDAVCDGSGLDLARELSTGRSITQTIVLTDAPSVDQTISALRAGVGDLIDQSMGLEQCLADLSQRVLAAAQRQKLDKKRAQRVKRLRNICRQLNDARHEVADQVESLCEDLVTAYQDLAGQVNQAQQERSPFGGMIKDELDFESLLRMTLEHLVEEAGPTNAAIFLPATMDEYSLGGYVNYDCGVDGAEMLLQHLADVAAPKLAECEGVVTLSDNQTLRHWFEEDADWLLDRHLAAITCSADDEVLAVVVLFRDATNPFDDGLAEKLDGLAPLLGKALAKVIRIHHRATPDECHEDGFDTGYDGYESGDGDSMPF